MSKETTKSSDGSVKIVKISEDDLRKTMEEAGYKNLRCISVDFDGENKRLNRVENTKNVTRVEFDKTDKNNYVEMPIKDGSKTKAKLKKDKTDNRKKRRN